MLKQKQNCDTLNQTHCLSTAPTTPTLLCFVQKSRS